MVDLIVVSCDLRPNVLDTLVKTGAEHSTDHHLVVSWIRLWRVWKEFREAMEQDFDWPQTLNYHTTPDRGARLGKSTANPDWRCSWPVDGAP